MTYSKYVEKLKEDVEWLCTSVEYFEDQLNVKKATKDDQEEVLDIINNIRKELNIIKAKTKNICFITKET